MSDLTPEQVEKWAGDEIASKHLKETVNIALPYAQGRPGILWQIALHAHALHLQLQATIERLEAENKRIREAAAYLHDRTVQVSAGRSVRDLDEAMSAVENALRTKQPKTGFQQALEKAESEMTVVMGAGDRWRESTAGEPE